jgi:hypothetical protein
MSILSIFILATTVIFVLSLLAQSFTRLKFCAVCVTISLTWLTLLIAWLVGYPIDPMLIGVLMGESVVGLYYLIEKKARVDWHIFRWPYLVTMTVLVYLVVGVRSGVWQALILLALIWIVWGSVFVLRKYPSVKKITERLLACCRDW